MQNLTSPKHLLFVKKNPDKLGHSDIRNNLHVSLHVGEGSFICNTEANSKRKKENVYSTYIASHRLANKFINRKRVTKLRICSNWYKQYFISLYTHVQINMNTNSSQ